MNALVLNCGSSSLKYCLFETSRDSAIVSGQLEGIGSVIPNHEHALKLVIEKMKSFSVDMIGHRVVHGAEFFSSAVVIDQSVMDKIRKAAHLAPLHNPYQLKGIELAAKHWPDSLQVAVFDTAFHNQLPRRAKHYAINLDFAKKNNVQRYGFHGTSYQYVSQLVAETMKLKVSDLRLICLHLGGGASACAIEYGKSVETSMGMTPLEGLVMGTRAGDIDAGAVLHLLQQSNIDAAQLSHKLNKESGLLGLSGVSNDLREIERGADQGNDGCRLAINIFAHRARKYIGAYAAVMGGVDAIVFTGGIGENSTTMRRRILQRLEFLGVSLCEDKNSDVKLDLKNSVSEISDETSRVKSFVVKTNEELMIARETHRLYGKTHNQAAAKPLKIPIAVSARHLHLTKETFKQLFGEKAWPTKLKDISQPGQYACEEQVSLIGPRGRIDGVRLLGPLRSKNQVEISRTDEFKLGVDAPVRNSGDTVGSAPIQIEGPAGTVHLKEGLICARRHIHMTPQEAKRLSLRDKEVTEVAITGGDRDLIFGDVLVRVHENYKLEMHIDTDEANACELGRRAEGDLIYTRLSELEGRIAL